MCVCCLSGEEIYGRGAEMATRQSLQSLLPDPVTQELPEMSMVWSQVTFPVKPSAGSKAFCPWTSGYSTLL